MFRLEKVFQNDDKFFISISNLFKSLFLYITIYLFIILEKNSIYDIQNYDIYFKSNYFLFSITFSIIFYLLIITLFKSHSQFLNYDKNILKKDFVIFVLSLSISTIISIFFEKNVNFTINIFYLIIIICLNLFFFQKFNKIIFFFLVNQNIIQKNILLIGSYESIKKILSEDYNKIYVYKCCIIFDKSKKEIQRIRSEFRIPIFQIDEDIRSLLEYHSLGQVWILDDTKIDINNMIKIVVKFSVDIIIVNLFQSPKNDNFINGKYSFINYEISRFHGTSFLIKIILDKILSLFFLIILSPIFLLSIILIYLEDGTPIFFTQDRTGWDGRRFKIYKLRSLKKNNFQQTDQVIIGDKRLLKIGKYIRKFSIDEVPQFFNVIMGDMSIVGPRPHMVQHDIFYSNLFIEFLKRHKASPGLTGWAQVNGYRGPTKDFQLMKKRMELDLWYLNNWSLFLDFLIIFKTFFIIFKHKGT